MSSKGIYSDGPYATYINVTKISDLTAITTNPFQVGGGVSLTNFMAVLETQSAVAGYEYCLQMKNHIMKV